MAKAKRKRKAKHNDISMAYRIDAAPRGMSKADVFRALIEAVRSGDGELPANLEVTWKWRNSPMKAMQEDDFASTVQNSGPKRGGFLKLMERRLLRDAAKYAPGWKGADTEKRSAAARKGWDTRRKHAQERAQSRAKRSEAARKGWDTRRAKARERAAALAREKRSKAAKKGRKR